MKLLVFMGPILVFLNTNIFFYFVFNPIFKITFLSFVSERSLPLVLSLYNTKTAQCCQGPFLLRGARSTVLNLKPWSLEIGDQAGNSPYLVNNTSYS